MQRKNSLSLIFFALVAFSLTVWLGKGQDSAGSNSQRFLSPPPEYIEYFTFGFRESMADGFWLRWIQDNDVCQTYLGAQPAQPIQGGVGAFPNPRHKFCDNSWSFKMLDAVTRLAPRFKAPYEVGAIILSVMTEDYEGSKVIFDRGVENYPNDWVILYRAAYHFLFDRQDLPRAAELLTRAERNGGPFWLSLLAARILSKTGQFELGMATLNNLKATIQDNPEQVAEVDKRIAELKRQMAQLPKSELTQ
jgi:hypothetical protein